MEYGKNESFVSVSAHLYWKVSGKESCCVQGNPCCHIILSAVSLTACLTCIVLALVTEQLHRCDCSVFVPISGKVLVSSVPNRNCEWCGFWSVWCPSVGNAECYRKYSCCRACDGTVTWIHSLLLTHFCTQYTEIGEDSVKKEDIICSLWNNESSVYFVRMKEG